jgi:hypothetical protein
MRTRPRSWVPYCPPATLVRVIRHYRFADVPPTIYLTELEGLGISRGLSSRVIGALEFLGLLDAAHRPTTAWERLRRRDDDRYRVGLAELINQAYRPLLNGSNDLNVKFATEKLAARPPAGQTARMVACLVGLCEEAGIVIRGSPLPRSELPMRKLQSPADPVALWVARMPQPGTPWPKSQRQRWLAALDAMLDAIYEV